MKAKLTCIISAICIAASLSAAADTGLSNDNLNNAQMTPVEAVNAALPEEIQAVLLQYKDSLGISQAYEQYILLPEMQPVINERISEKTFEDEVQLKKYFERLINDILEYGKITISTDFVTGEKDITVSVSTDKPNEKIIITVFKPSESGYSLKDITEINAESIIGFIRQDTTNENGKKDFIFRMPEGALAGDYIINVSCNALKDMSLDLRSSSFYYADEFEMERAQQAVNDATADTIETAISNPCFNFELGDMYTDNKDEINTAIINIRDNQAGFKSVDEIYRAFYAAYVIAGLEKGNVTQESIKTAAEKANIVYPSGYEKYAQYTSEIIKNNLPQELSAAKIEKLLSVSYALAALNNGTRDEASGILSKYSKELGLDGTSEYAKYVSLGSNTQELDAKITNKGYVKPSEVLETLNSAIASLNAVNHNPGYSGGGGGGGGSRPSSGGSTSISTTPVVDKNTVVSPTVEYENVFNDMETAQWAKTSVNYLASVGVVNGDGSGNYYPHNNITRAEFIKMLVMAFELYNEDADSNFSDSEETDWHYKYVSSAYGAGITTGITDELFGVDDMITRQQAAVMLDRVNNETADNIREYQAFADENIIADYALESVRRMYCSGVINGTDSENFAPLQNLTRAQAAAMIYRMLKA